jgi:hypothetical protein
MLFVCNFVRMRHSYCSIVHIALYNIMRRTVVILLMLSFTTICLFMMSCAKKQSPSTPFTRIIGKWKKTKYATDDNNNGIIDPGEISSVAPGVDNELYFKNDETGMETSVINKEPSTPLVFNWYILADDSLRIAYKANDTITYNIVSISSIDLTLTTNTKQGLAWYYYRKL